MNGAILTAKGLSVGYGKKVVVAANARLEAAWCLWSYLLNPSGYVRRPHIMMAASSIASSWQMNHNAAALRNDLPLALDLLSNMFDEE